MLIKWDICKCEFDHAKAGKCDCDYGQCEEFLKCPECGIHVDLPDEIREKVVKAYNDNTIFTHLEKELDMK